MQVKLNAFRGEGRPGDVVDVDDADAAVLIAHGAAFPVDDFDSGPDAELTPAGRTVVRGAAALQSASGADAGSPAP